MSNATPVEHLPMINDFRHRGHEVTRLETFVDAAFAFAVTLLVVSFDALPKNFTELATALKGAPAFLASFAILAMFWSLHHKFSQRIGLEDVPIRLISLLFVAITLLFVYPLRMIMETSFFFITGGWSPSPVEMMQPTDLALVYVIYGIGFFMMSMTIALLNQHALRRAELLQLNEIERVMLSAEVWAMIILMLTASASVIFALTLPGIGLEPLHSALPGVTYATLGISMPLLSLYYARAIARMKQAGEQQ